MTVPLEFVRMNGCHLLRNRGKEFLDACLSPSPNPEIADALTTFTGFILKSSAPFAAGVVLFPVVRGFFKGVESVLNDDTKLEIAVSLLDHVEYFHPDGDLVQQAEA